MKKPIKNKRVKVRGFVSGIATPIFAEQELHCVITNDEKGKTLSVSNGIMQFTIPFEPIERYLR